MPAVLAGATEKIMKKIIILIILVMAGAVIASPLLPAPEFRPAIKIPDKPTAVACNYGAIKAAVRLGLATPAASVIEAVAGCSAAVAVKYSAKLNQEDVK
jgi:hypothetical protein